jgi:predicted RecB family nuclease
MKSRKPKSELFTLKNVGPATYKDLQLLGITTIEALAKADPDQLYRKLEKITCNHHDPCMWDIFAAIIHQAKTGKGYPWWKWTPIRKKKQSVHPLCKHS